VYGCTALINPVFDTQRSGINYVISMHHADVLLVSRQVSRQIALALKRTYIATLCRGSLWFAAIVRKKAAYI
jgi:Ni,Fe-hydrogenase III small subunit